MVPKFEEAVKALLALAVVGSIIGLAFVRGAPEAMTALVAASGIAVGFYFGRQHQTADQS